MVGLQYGAQLRQDGACADFDRVWLALGRPSYADLLAKVSLLLPPSADAAVQWVHAPRSAGRAERVACAAGARALIQTAVVQPNAGRVVSPAPASFLTRLPPLSSTLLVSYSV